MTPEPQVAARAKDILLAQGTDPLDASLTLWAAACETARSDLAVEAARSRRTCLVTPNSDAVSLWECPCAECTRLDWEAHVLDGWRGTLTAWRKAHFPEVWA